MLPDEPVSPRVFMEEVVPSLFRSVELDAADREVDLGVGVVLEGEEGGDWTIRFAAGELEVQDTRAHDAQLTVIQSVEDWRAALWEGRPSLVADAVTRLREDGAEAMRPPPGPHGARPDPLRGISDLRGRIEIVIEDDRGAAGDWSVGILVGEGPVPDSPQATIRLGAAEAEAIRLGDLHPLEALITGQLQLEGDLGLILQLQAVAMTLSMAAGNGGGR